MNNKTIILPNWLYAHGNYVFVALIILLFLLLYGVSARKPRSIVISFLSLLALYFIVPDAHEPKSSDLHGVLAQIVLLVIFLFGLILIVKFIKFVIKIMS